MKELPTEYFQVISEQLVFVSVFLGGISATILGTLITKTDNSRIFKAMLFFLSLAAVSFIVAVFGMNKIKVVLTPGSPYENTEDVIFYPRIVGGLAFYLGIYSLLFVIGLAGRYKSKKLGYVTSVLSLIAGILIFTLT